MNSSPLVSVVVLNRNKKEKLLRCLDSVFNNRWSPLEVICVDNASEDGSVEAVGDRYGDRVKTIARTENSVTQARNEGLLAAKGEILLSLDNDILLPDAGLIAKAADLLSTHPEVAVLTAKITSPESPNEFQKEHWWHPFELAEHQGDFFYTDYFPEAAVFFRRETFVETGGYDETFFMGFEQADLAIRMLRRGWKILYCPTLVCVEDDTREEFRTKRHPIHYYNLRNKLWTSWKHDTFWDALGFCVSRSLVAMVRGIRYGYPDLIAKAMFQGCFPPKEIRDRTAPMSPAERESVRRARKGELLPGPGSPG